MNSERKLRASRENAKKSTGPRTAAGKSRSSRNATRHGLSRMALADTTSWDQVTQIAHRLCENDSFLYRYDVALEIAEAQVVLDRIRWGRADIIARGARTEKQQQLEDFCAALPILKSLERYERAALARKRRAIRKFDALRDEQPEAGC